jgi:hypothetical protein
MNQPDLYEVQEDLETLVQYFEELEDRLTTESKHPVHLVETRTARRASIAVYRFLEADRERRRGWRQSEPSEAAVTFAKLVFQFLSERQMTSDELAQQVSAAPTWLDDLLLLVDD